MTTKTIYQFINTNCGYYSLTVKETEKSIIVIEHTNQSGGYDKEIRYYKNEQIMQEIANLIKTDDVFWFVHQFTEDRVNSSYWQSWKKVF